MQTEIALIQHIPWDKSWIIRMGVLDLIHERTQIADFLRAEHSNLSDDLLALERAVTVWHSNQPINVGESGTLYRYLQFTAWKHNLNKTFITSGTLKSRNILDDPTIIHMPQEELLELDNHTSQWASAAALNDDPERIKHPPYKLGLTYLAIDHWKSHIAKKSDWTPRQDDTIRAQAEAFIEFLEGKAIHFAPQQAEDYCFARAFDLMTAEEGLARWPALVGHESNRIEEMEAQLKRARAGGTITSHDHRVVQAIAMLSVVESRKSTFAHPDCVRKSWPQFWEFLQSS